MLSASRGPERQSSPHFIGVGSSLERGQPSTGLNLQTRHPPWDRCPHQTRVPDRSGPGTPPAGARKRVALRDVVACEDGRIWGYRVNTDGVWSWLLRVTVEVHAGGWDAAGTTGKPTSATGLIAR